MVPTKLLITKAFLLSEAKISLSQNILQESIKANSKISIPLNTENHHANEWIFLRLSKDSRVRMTVSEQALLELEIQDDAFKTFMIINKSNRSVVADNIYIEEALVHSPRHLFLGLYETCKANCKFCPLSHSNINIHYSLNDIFKDIKDNSEKNYESVGITTAIPRYMTEEEVGEELAFVISKISLKINKNIPIGVSTKCPSINVLQQLKASGASEIRLNLEVYNYDLANMLMPNKKIDDILESIRNACIIFGKGKVSSNLIIGLGESDDDIIKGIEALAQLGAIATLYPYDSLNGIGNNMFETPSSERLITLAQSHKEILNNYNLNPLDLKTMCPGCAASHIFPGKDL